MKTTTVVDDGLIATSGKNWLELILEEDGVEVAELCKSALLKGLHIIFLTSNHFLGK